VTISRSSRLSDVMRYETCGSAILQRPSSAHGKSLRGLHVLELLVETSPSNITSPSPRLDQPHTSDCVELPSLASLECGVQATGIIMLGLVAHPSAACPSMYEPGCVLTPGRCHPSAYMWQTIAQDTEAAPTAYSNMRTP
jgi:hypothetical protein